MTTRASIAVTLTLLAMTTSFAWAQDPVSTDRDGARPLSTPAATEAFHFAVFGDRTGGPRSGLEVLRQAVRDTNLLSPDLVMTVGDLIQGYSPPEPWMEQMHEYRGIMDDLEMPWYPVAGNHDIYWRGTKAPPEHHEHHYEEHFGPLWYSFRHKNSGFVVLYSDEGNPETGKRGWRDASVNRMSDEQLAWLEKALGELQDADHVFVFLHHPRWWSEYYEGTNWDAVHAKLAAAGNVSAVFAGHIHRRRYDGRRDGIEYFALATTGGGIPFDVPGTGHMHHVDVVTVRGSEYAIATIPVGTTQDPRKLTPARWSEIDALRGMAVEHLDAISYGQDGGAEGTYRLRVANPTSLPIRVDFAVDRSDRATWFTTRERSVDVAPGKTATATFSYDRRATGVETVRVPRVEARFTYLDESFPVSLPARSMRCRVEFRELPQGLFDEVVGAHLDTRGRGIVRVPSSSVSLPDGPLTVEGWLRAPSYAGRRGYLAKTERSEFGIFVSDGRPDFSVHLGGRYVSARAPKAVLEPDTWHHLAGVYDGREVRLYVDGKRVAVTSGSGPRRRNAHPFYIGADTDGRGRATSPSGGRIDEVRLSSVARYTESFTPSRRHEPDDATVLLFHLDRPLGPFAPDHSAGARHADLVSPAKLVAAEE